MRKSCPLVPRPQPHPWGSMHLAKIMSVVKGCRKAIWSEYEKLYSNDALEILGRIAPKEDFTLEPLSHAIIRAFEVDWFNWEW